MGTHVFTSVVCNYLPKARVLARSVKRFHPDFHFHLVLSDALPPWLRLDQEPFDSVITVPALGLENPLQWIFKHTLVELSTAVKGFAVLKLLEEADCSEVLYLDPDIVVLSSLDRLLAEFSSASILLTPHLTEPETSLEAVRDNEICVLQHGICNLGFLGVKNSAEGRRFGAWWAERLYHFCYDDIPNGIFTDQRWVDLVPAFFPDHRLLRDSVYNVCTWNLTHRKVEGSIRKGLTVNGDLIAFYHFSGLDSGAQEGMLNKYGHDMPALYELRRWYLAECDRMGQRELSHVPWAYGYFDNGEPITTPHRRLYRDRTDLQLAFPNPFSTAHPNSSYFRWFEANDESNVTSGAPASASTPAPPQSAPETEAFRGPPAEPQYRVFLLALPPDAQWLDETATRLLERTYRRSQLFAAGSPALLSRVPAEFKHFEVNASEYGAAFAAVLRTFGDQDSIIVTAGVDVPDNWDLRLAWTAARQPGIAAVYPLIAGDSAIALDPSGELIRLASNELLDGLCCQYSRFELPEVHAASAGCVYVRAEAVRAVSSVTADLRPGSFVDGSRKLRYSHALADHVFAGSLRGRAVGVSPRRFLSALLPQDRSTTPEGLTPLRDRVRAHLARWAPPPPPVRSRMLPRNLHIMHSWGGGLERWVSGYSRADQDHDNFVLKSVGTWGAFGSALHLYRHIDDPEPLQTFPLCPPVKATDISHRGYAAALTAVLEEHAIGRIYVSSMVGHSLDLLRQGLPTTVICHDYYPFCPAFNVTFDGVCHTCRESELATCTMENPHHRFFRNMPPSAWLDLRTEFVRAVRESQALLIAPCASVSRLYAELVPELAGHFRIIPHGTARLASPLSLSFEAGQPLRVVVLGSLAPHKGGVLFQQMIRDLMKVCDLFLVGCGEHGKEFERPGVTVISEYNWEELPEILGRVKPDLGLLLSVVPETFSYTLQELMELGVPPLATRIGSFADRIQDGINGFLCEPEPDEIAGRVKALADDRRLLQRVHERLKRQMVRGLSDMLADYRTLDTDRPYCSRAYFRRQPEAEMACPAGRDRALQLFWRSDKGEFREDNSESCLPSDMTGRQTVLFQIAEVNPPVKQLRLDPSNRPGFFSLYSIRLRDNTGRIAWSWDGDQKTLQEAGHHQIAFLGSPDGQPGLLLYLAGEDASIILPLGASALARLRGGGRLEVEFSLELAEKHMPQLVAAALAGEAAQISLPERNLLIRQLTPGLEHAQANSAAKGVRIERLIQELHASRARISDLESSLSWRLSLPVRAAGGLVLRLIEPFRKRIR